MTILAPPDLPVFRETIQPRAAFLIYEIDAHLLATVHPLSATRNGHAVIGVGRPLTQRDLQGWLLDLAGQARAPALTLLPEHLLALEEAVSYTHLDVYKRQVFTRHRPISPPPLPPMRVFGKRILNQGSRICCEPPSRPMANPSRPGMGARLAHPPPIPKHWSASSTAKEAI